MSETTLNLLHDLVKKAQHAGADAADAVAVDARSRSISWRSGKPEDVEGSEGEDIGLRVFIGQKQAMVSTSNRSSKSLSALVEKTVAMARAVPEDKYCGLAPEEALHTGPLADLELFDATEVSAETLTNLAQEADEAALAVQGVTTSPGAGASASTWGISLVTSHGFSGTYQGSSFSVSASAVAGTGTGMERDYDFSSARHFSDLTDATKIGCTAGEYAVRRLNAGRMKSGKMPVVFAPRVANSILGHFAGAISGTSIARGSSFLADMLEKQIFASHITITEDPLKKRGLSSKPFDGEGVTVGARNFIQDGILTSWALNSATARQLGMHVTGNATRGTGSTPGIGTSNLYMAAGTASPAELIADIKDGLYVTELIGMGVNGVTGDYSRGAAGFRIQNGEITNSVSEITIAGNLKDMFSTLVPASDLEFKYSTNAPTVRIEGMTIAGSA